MILSSWLGASLEDASAQAGGVNTETPKTLEVNGATPSIVCSPTVSERKTVLTRIILDSQGEMSTGRLRLSCLRSRGRHEH